MVLAVIQAHHGQIVHIIAFQQIERGRRLPERPKAVKAQTESGKFTPQMFVLHDTKVTWKGSLPKTDAELSQRVQEQGGL